MAQFDDPRTYHRPILGSLLFTREGDLDLSWLFVLLTGIAGVIVFVWINVFAIGVPVSVIISSWAFIGGAFTAVLVAAVPIAKAKILAKTLPSDAARTIASAGLINIEKSTDIFELSQQTQEIG